MGKIKGQKLYVLMAECQVIGIWSNLSVLVRNIANNDNASLYLKIYRQLKKHTEGGKNIDSFKYDFENDGKTYQIKIEILQ